MASETVQACYVKVIFGFKVVGADGALIQKEHVYEKNFSDGNGAEQVQSVLNDDARAMNATSADLDLDTQTDFAGTASGATGVRVLYVENLDSAAKMQVGGGDWAGTSQLLSGSTDKVNVLASGLLLWVAPGTSTATTAGVVTATTADGLGLASAAATGNCKVAAAITNT